MAGSNPQPGFTRVAFGDVVRLSKERSSDPAAAGFERYVGLEHLDPGDLTVRRWGDVATGTTFTRVFQPGQVLFGKRRAYQRKVAVPDFSGVCSADIYVFESRDPNYLFPDLLSFICQTHAFLQHAINTSAGSLSPRTNWHSLATYQFALPPIEDQQRLATMLRAAGRLRQHLVRVTHLQDVLETSLLSQYLWRSSRGPKTTPLSAILQRVEYGTSKRTYPHKQGVPVLRIPNILRGALDLTSLKYAHLSPNEVRRFRLNSGDILIVRTNGNPDYVGRCVAVPELTETMVFASYLLRIVVDSTLLRPEFGARVLNSPLIKRQMRRYIRSSAGNYNISASGVRSISIPCPSLSLQDRMISDFMTISQSRDVVLARVAFLDSILDQLRSRLQTATTDE